MAEDEEEEGAAAEEEEAAVKGRNPGAAEEAVEAEEGLEKMPRPPMPSPPPTNWSPPNARSGLSLPAAVGPPPPPPPLTPRIA